MKPMHWRTFWARPNDEARTEQRRAGAEAAKVQQVEHLAGLLMSKQAVDEGNGDTLDALIDTWTAQAMTATTAELIRQERQIQIQWARAEASRQAAAHRWDAARGQATRTYDACEAAATRLGVRWQRPTTPERPDPGTWSGVRAPGGTTEPAEPAGPNEPTDPPQPEPDQE